MSGKRVGEVSHYFDQINVAVLNLNASIKIGDQVHFLGHGSDFRQKVTSIQIEHENIKLAKSGDEVAIEVLKPVRKGTIVYLLTED